MNGEISIQNGDFSILNGENSPLRFYFKEGSKRFSKKSEWRNLHFRMEISPILNGENSLLGFVLKEGSKRFSKAAAKYIIISLNRTTEHW